MVKQKGREGSQQGKKGERTIKIKDRTHGSDCSIYENGGAGEGGRLRHGQLENISLSFFLLC